MAMESNPSPSTASCASDQVPRCRMTISGKLALAVCIVHAGLFLVLLSGTTMSFILGIGMLSASYLVLYVGFPLAALLWAASMAYWIAMRQEWRRLIWTGVKYAIILLGSIGLGLWLIGMVPPTAKTFTLGYWLHVKVWADVDEIRTWAARRAPAHDSFRSIPQAQWPSCMRRMPFSFGTVWCDLDRSTVTFSEGGGFGHWGFTVAPKGTPIPDGWCVLRLEESAWVWHEEQ